MTKVMDYYLLNISCYPYNHLAGSPISFKNNLLIVTV